EGQLFDISPFAQGDGVSLYANIETAKLLQELAEQRSYKASEVAGLLAAYFSLARSGDYMALMAYLQHSTPTVTKLEEIRRRLRHTFRKAITIGFGPRFLHSTGQLHKGGSNNGLFLQITVKDSSNPPIPQANYGFSTLKQAQA